VLDLDHFKRINDVHGHEIGDRVLTHVGATLARELGPRDIAARWGGEEFVLGLFGTGREEAIDHMQRLLECVMHESAFVLEGSALDRVSFTAGVAEYPTDGADLGALLRSADAALYTAKAAGRARVLGAARLPPPAEQLAA
jgi:diguanylate cyclase (GGDEF)-like protein